MPRYLLESYVPRREPLDVAAARARAVGKRSASGSASVRYVRTTFLAEDETCFHVFEATSREALVEAARYAGLQEVRIIEAVESEGKEGS